MRYLLSSLACAIAACGAPAGALGPDAAAGTCARAPLVLEPWASFSTAAIPTQMQVGVDREGRVRVVSGESNNQSVLVLTQTSDGGAPTPVHASTLEHPYAVALGDVNLDGWPDVVTGNRDSAAVLLGAPGGLQAPLAVEDAGPAAIWGLAVADFDADRRLDLVAGSLYSSLLMGSRNQGDGHFEPWFTLDAGGPMGYAQPGDFNRDGLDDAVFTRFFFGIVTVRAVADGGVPEVAATANPVGGNEGDLVVADFDGQLGPDIAQAGANETVVIFFNRGDGTFVPRPVFSAGASVMGVAAGDLNVDGQVDLVVTDFDRATFTLLLNQADGGFAATTLDAGVASTAHAGIADLDADGLPDVVVSGAFEVRLFHNVTACGPLPVGDAGVDFGPYWVGVGCTTLGIAPGGFTLLAWLVWVIVRRSTRS